MQTDNRHPKAQPGSLHPACSACGVPFVEHDGLIRTCAKLPARRISARRQTDPGRMGRLVGAYDT